MKRSLFIAAGVAAFLVCLIAMIPAHQVARRLPAGVTLGGVGGTIWSGRARTLTMNGLAFGALEWSCRPWRLLVLEWSCTVGLSPQGGEVAGDVSGDFGPVIVAQNIEGRVPISAFEGIATPRGWRGDLEFDLDQVSLAGRRPVAASGTVYLRGLRAPGAAAQPLGDFELAVGEGTVGGATLNGRLRDLGGPLHVRGSIELGQDGRYLLTGEAAPGPGAGTAIFDTLSFLGPPDSQGRRPFTIEGSL